GVDDVKDINIPLTPSEHQQALETENALLRSEVSRLTELLTAEQWLVGQKDDIVSSDMVNADTAMERRRSERINLLKLQLYSLPARVLIRTPTTWNSTLWLDVGQEDNEAIGRVVVAKNSPVVVGNSLIGIVDIVNRHQCRVRLITDASCSPSVRAVRGDPQRQQLLDQLDSLAGTLARDESFFSSSYERGQFLESLLDIRDRLLGDQQTWMLAKGVLRGSVVPLWRAKGSLLHGVGFNYDFDDEEGPARDLTTGRILGRTDPAVPLLQVDDILVTTGFDGILPAGLRVAQVTAVHPLAEGDYFYELEARPTVGDMDTLSLVTVLPPLISTL
ncbi:MAG: hypothetical protein E6Q59_01930, partial [Nitrosomonas sp.]